MTNRVASGAMGLRRGKKVDPHLKRAALRKVTARSAALIRQEGKVEKLRELRNDAMVEAAEYANATEIANATVTEDTDGIKQSYVSRVIRSGGKPSSGGTASEKRTKDE